MTNNQKLLHRKLQATLLNFRIDGKFKRDVEFAESLGYKHSTVSVYLSGKAPISKLFLKRFENKFKFKLEDVILENTNTTKAPMEVNKKLLVLIAKKVGVSKNEIEKVIR
ncbi:MAG: hypothetical protein ABIO04_07310 [Ferruginibacter sp.]